MSGTELHKTPLHDLHVRLGAKSVPFAGYAMPVQYPDGIIAEHSQTRTSAGLFDVSHMGQIILRHVSGDVGSAALALEELVPANIVGLAEGRQRYGLFTDETGGILDDLMIASKPGHLFLVVNASRKSEDFEHLNSALGGRCRLELLEGRALLALQGPASAAVLERVIPGTASMRFMDSLDFDYDGAGVWVSRSGYTGEDGFEVSVRSDDAVELAEALLAQEEVGPVGLGARDSLRLEAGLCLHGNDIDPSTSPVEAALEWSIQKVRRAGGDRAGGFPGDSRILAELQDGAGRRRIGLKPGGRAPIRRGTPLFGDEDGEESIGVVTSGGFGPTFGGPLSMGYVETRFSVAGQTVFGQVRGRMLPAEVHPMPFVQQRYSK